MQDRDLKRFAELLAGVSEQYGQAPLKPGGLSLFFAALREFPFDAVAAALTMHVKTSVFMPKAADIVTILQGTAEDRGRLAFQKVLRAISSHGSYSSIRFEDPRIHYALDRMGGWQKVCLMPLDETPFREKDFCQHYALAERAGITWDSPGVPRYFPGIIEVQNRALGIESPVLLAGAPRMLPMADKKALDYHAPEGDPGKMDPERIQKLIGTIVKKEA
jgi:hypothetical protein